MPTRSCIVCRGRGEQSDLLRIGVVERDGGRRFAFDALGRFSGRGVYCHRTVKCLLSKRFREACAVAAERGWGNRGKVVDKAVDPLRWFGGVVLRGRAETSADCAAVIAELRATLWELQQAAQARQAPRRCQQEETRLTQLIEELSLALAGSNQGGVKTGKPRMRL